MAPWESVPSAREVVSQLQASGGEKDAKELLGLYISMRYPKSTLKENGT